MLASRKKRTSGGGWFLFWLAFILGITLLFILNLERIKKTLNETKLLEKLVSGKETEEDPELELERHIQDLAFSMEGAESGRGTGQSNLAETETPEIPPGQATPG